ncbi:peptidase S41 family protein [Podospora appendiculata]|uniref:Peptidase S41 family protein n=1 Tax=Podospora appendiculata TaxID=314037 RepID=A0AAE1CCN6_9PEZI|nr:peptidase S41 family protein [Podospora appendiculata]
MGPFNYRLAAAAALVFGDVFGINGVAAAPAPQVTPGTVVAPNPSACATVQFLTASLLAASPAATPTVPATVAIECLHSVPNRAEAATKLIKSLKAFVSWQSSLAFLKDPPAAYMLPGVDILAGLDNISDVSNAEGFVSEFDFQLSIAKLISSAHDGHFSYRPDVFKAFGFRNKLAADIVSVSVDGVQVPKLYHYADLVASMNSTSGNGTKATGAMPPAIVSINGEPAADVIERRNLIFSVYQDPDSQWNAGMQSYALPGGTSFIAASLDFQGPNLTITYDNGAVKTADSFAIIRPGINFTGINIGDDFYQRFCDPDSAAATAASATATQTPTATPSTAAAPPEPTIAGYPWPVVRDSGANATSGYFLNGTGYDNVAVLAVSGFEPAGDFDTLGYLRDFQDTVSNFLAESKAKNKKRLVIDLTANGGGFVVAGFELFAQLFPDAPRFQADNIRETDSLKLVSQITGQFLNEIIAFQASTTTTTGNSTISAADAARASALSALQSSSIVSNLVPGGLYSPDGASLDTVDAILAPVVLNGDRFTAYQQAPLNNTSAGFNLTGTGSEANPPPAVFSPSNVVILTDGTCGSTCTIFSYLMILQLNIQTTVIGGRPQPGPMQSVAGVEGAQIFYFEDMQAAAAAVMTLRPESNVPGSDLALMGEGYALSRAAIPLHPGAVNGKNAFSRMDATTPLQFLYQPANCRIFYTREMVYGPAEVWKRTVDATWTDPARFCVEGSRVAMNMSAVGTDGGFFGNASTAGGDAKGLGGQVSGAGKVVGGSGLGWTFGVAFVVVVGTALLPA